MDVFLATASKRDTRRFDARRVDESHERTILDAGRLAGSARNGQPWRFHVVCAAAARRGVSESVYRPELVVSAGLVVALTVVKVGRMYDFDAGRAAQNMMLAAWNLGVVSCPNGIARPEKLLSALGLDDERRGVTVLSFGYPMKPRDPARRSAEHWSSGAARLPLEAIVDRH